MPKMSRLISLFLAILLLTLLAIVLSLNIFSHPASQKAISFFSGLLDNSSYNSTSLSSQTFIQLPCSKIFNISRVSFSDVNSESAILRSCSPLYYYYKLWLGLLSITRAITCKFPLLWIDTMKFIFKEAFILISLISKPGWLAHMSPEAVQLSQTHLPKESIAIRNQSHIKQRQSLKPQTNLQLGSALNFSTCKMGDYYHDNNQRPFGLCYIDDNFTGIRTIRVQPIFCRYQCPSTEPQVIIEGGCNAQQQSMFRLWSNSSMWPNATLPQEGSNVTIPKECKVILDVNPPKMNIFIIKGTLIIPNDLNEVLIDTKHSLIKKIS